MPTRPRRTTTDAGRPLQPHEQKLVDERIERLEASPELTWEGKIRKNAFRKTHGKGLTDEETRLTWLERYSFHGGIYRACAEAGICYDTYKRYHDNNEEFRADCVKALELRREMVLNSAISRAVEGVKKPIIGGKDRDQIVGYETVYSDGLAQNLLRGLYPEQFGTKIQVDANVKGGALVVPPVAASPEEWERTWGQHARQVQERIQAEAEGTDLAKKPDDF